MGKESANRWVFNGFRNIPNEPAEVRTSGRLFHTVVPAIAKSQLPKVDSLTDGRYTTSRLAPAEPRTCRPGLSATRTGGLMYAGAVPCSRFVCQHGKLVRNAFLDANPMETGSSIRDTIVTMQVRNEPY